VATAEWLLPGFGKKPRIKFNCVPDYPFYNIVYITQSTIKRFRINWSCERSGGENRKFRGERPVNAAASVGWCRRATNSVWRQPLQFYQTRVFRRWELLWLFISLPLIPTADRTCFMYQSSIISVTNTYPYCEIPSHFNCKICWSKTSWPLKYNISCDGIPITVSFFYLVCMLKRTLIFDYFSVFQKMENNNINGIDLRTHINLCL